MVTQVYVNLSMPGVFLKDNFMLPLFFVCFVSVPLDRLLGSEMEGTQTRTAVPKGGCRSFKVPSSGKLECCISWW